ncbi:peptidase, partial [Pseudomonas syringae]|nr:peptidase [Pseudomonas syringae]
GGPGADVFTYDDASDSTSAMPDEILDFTSGADKIDLSGILKKSQLSTVRIVERFTGRPGEIVLDYNEQTGRASLSLDLTGNARPDVLINAQGVIRSADLVTGKDLKRITAEPHKTPDPKLAPKPGASDTVYGFNSNTGNPSMSLNASSKAPWFKVTDPGGNDTLDFSGFKQAQRIDLRSGAASSVGGGVNNVAIAKNAVIENAIGGSGDDLLIGNFTNNVLKGGAGTDTLWGVGGANTYAYDKASDSTYPAADLIMDFVSGRDKIDLSALQREANTPLRLVDSFTGRIGDTVVTFNPQSGRYFVAVDLTGNRQTDFLVKSTRLIKPQDVLGLAS